jgi:ribosome-associated toxin RatA of RatAB toxin-antitoxin module
MRATRGWTLALAVSLGLLAAAPSGSEQPATAGLTGPEVTRLDAGEVVVKTEPYTTADGTRAARVKAYGVINRPPESVWAVMLDYRKFHEFMPRLEKVAVLAQTKDTMKVTQTLSLPLGTLSYTLDLTFEAARRRVSWKLDRSRPHDIADTFGTWDFLPYAPNRTLIHYTSFIDTGMSVPKLVETYLVKSDLPEMLLSLRRRTESDGAWRKEQQGGSESAGTIKAWTESVLGR